MSSPLTVVADAPSISDRYGDLGSMLGDNFRKRWRAEPLPGQQDPARVSWSEHEGFVISRAEMPPLKLESRPIDGRRATKYYVYSSNRVTRLERDLGAMEVAPGEILILSNAIRTRWTMPHGYVCMNAVIEADIFHKYVRDPEAVLGRRIRFAYGLNNVLLGLVDSAWAMALEGRFASDSSSLVRTFLETMAFALDARMEQPQEANGALALRREQARQYIQAHYRSGQLTIAAIAAELGVSPRYLQLAFAEVDQSPLDYLRNVRLSAAARQLQDPARRALAITRIAYDCGFGSSAHFATEFRRRFGHSPRAYRAQALEVSGLRPAGAATDGPAAPFHPRRRPSPARPE